MSKKFTKQVVKWGLLRRVAKKDQPWSFVNDCDFVFNSRKQAFNEANELNISDGTPAYLYKPVVVMLHVEIDKAFGAEDE
jgi:hypothetical protein